MQSDRSFAAIPRDMLRDLYMPCKTKAALAVGVFFTRQGQLRPAAVIPRVVRIHLCPWDSAAGNLRYPKLLSLAG